MPTEQNIVPDFGKGRPDKGDKKKLKQFSRMVGTRLWELASNYRIGKLVVPGHRPLKKYHVLPLKIKVSSSCDGCKACIKKCPVQAISRTDPKVTDTQRCIVCMRCVKVCPKKARRIPKMVMFVVRHKLKKVCSERKEPEFFIL